MSDSGEQIICSITNDNKYNQQTSSSIRYSCSSTKAPLWRHSSTTMPTPFSSIYITQKSDLHQKPHHAALPVAGQHHQAYWASEGGQEACLPRLPLFRLCEEGRALAPQLGGNIMQIIDYIDHCDRLRLLGRPRNEQEKAEIRQIQLELKRYNELLLDHTQAFTAATQVAKQKNKKRAKACMGQPPTVPYMHLTLAANEISNRHELSQCSESFLAQYHEKRLQTLMTMQMIGDHDERLSDFNGSSFFQDIGEQEEEYQSYWNWQSAAN